MQATLLMLILCVWWHNNNSIVIASDAGSNLTELTTVEVATETSQPETTAVQDVNTQPIELHNSSLPLLEASNVSTTTLDSLTVLNNNLSSESGLTITSAIKKDDPSILIINPTPEMETSTAVVNLNNENMETNVVTPMTDNIETTVVNSHIIDMDLIQISQIHTNETATPMEELKILTTAPTTILETNTPPPPIIQSTTAATPSTVNGIPIIMDESIVTTTTTIPVEVPVVEMAMTTTSTTRTPLITTLATTTVTTSLTNTVPKSQGSIVLIPETEVVVAEVPTVPVPITVAPAVETPEHIILREPENILVAVTQSSPKPVPITTIAAATTTTTTITSKTEAAEPANNVLIAVVTEAPVEHLGRRNELDGVIETATVMTTVVMSSSSSPPDQYNATSTSSVDALQTSTSVDSTSNVVVENVKSIVDLEEAEFFNTVTVVFSLMKDLYWQDPETSLFKDGVSCLLNGDSTRISFQSKEFQCKEINGNSSYRKLIPEDVILVMPSPRINDALISVSFFVRNSTSKDVSSVVPRYHLLKILRHIGSSNYLAEKVGLQVNEIYGGIRLDSLLLSEKPSSILLSRHSLLLVLVAAVTGLCIVILLTTAICIRCRQVVKSNRSANIISTIDTSKISSYDVPPTSNSFHGSNSAVMMMDDVSSSYDSIAKSCSTNFLEDGWVIPYYENAAVSTENVNNMGNTKL